MVCKVSQVAETALFTRGKKKAPLAETPSTDAITGGFFPAAESDTADPHRIAVIEFPSFEKPAVSIIVPVFNKWSWTYNCLKSVSGNTGSEIPYEVIVGNDASTDATSAMLSRIIGITVLENKTNLGFLKNCNNAAKAAKGKYIAFLNNDTLVTGRWLYHLYTLLESDPTIGLAGAKLLNADQSLQEAGSIVFSDPRESSFNYGRYDNPSEYQYNYLKEVDYCSGACFLVRKDAFERLHGFDEQYAPAYFEDTDLAFTMRSLGYKVVYQPKAEVIHAEGISHGKDIGDGVKNYMEVNRVKFHNKWHKVLKTENVKNSSKAFLARDRSQGKKILLYIDHKVPARDRDAGSLVTYEYLKILLDLGYKIIFWPDDLQNTEPYTSELQQMGIEVVYGPNDFKGFVKKNGRFIDIVFLARPRTSVYYIEEIEKFTKAKRVYVCHDLHFLREQRQGQVEADDRLLKTAEESRKAELHLMKRTHCTVVFSDVEKELLQRIDPSIRVEVLPFVQEVTSGIKGFEERRDMVFVGNYKHAPNEDAVFWFINDIFPDIQPAIPGVRFVAAGSDPTPRMLALHSPDILVTGYVENIASYYQLGRVFVSPLRYGAGLKGKILQAMSHGTPVVGTSMSFEGMNVVDGEHVFIADDPELIVNRIVELYHNKPLWETVSANARQFIEDNYANAIVKEKFRVLLADLR